MVHKAKFSTILKILGSLAEKYICVLSSDPLNLRLAIYLDNIFKLENLKLKKKFDSTYISGY